MAITQVENNFGQVQQSLDTPRVVNKVVSRDSDSVDLEGGGDGDCQETFNLQEYLASSVLKPDVSALVDPAPAVDYPGVYTILMCQRPG